MEYTTLTDADKLAIAKDALRARETEHFTLSLVEDPGSHQRRAVLESQIATLKAEIQALEDAGAHDPEQPVMETPPDPPAATNKPDEPTQKLDPDSKPKAKRAPAKKKTDD